MQALTTLITILKFYIPKNKLSDYGYNDYQLQNKIYLLILLYTKGNTESGLFFGTDYLHYDLHISTFNKIIYITMCSNFIFSIFIFALFCTL